MQFHLCLSATPLAKAYQPLRHQKPLAIAVDVPRRSRHHAKASHTQRRLLLSLQMHPKAPQKKVVANERRLRMVSADGAHENGICVDAGNDTGCYSCVPVSTKQLHQDQHLIMSGADNNMQICCCWWTQGINKDIECWKLMIQGEEHYHMVTTWKRPIQEAASSWSGGSGGSSETIFERASMAWLAVLWCCWEVQNQARETATLLFSLPTGHPPNLTAGHLDHPEKLIFRSIERWAL